MERGMSENPLNSFVSQRNADKGNVTCNLNHIRKLNIFIEKK